MWQVKTKFLNKMKITYFLLIAFLLFSCEKEAEFSVSNTMNVERTDEIVILTKDELAQKVELQEGLLPVFELEEDIVIPSQLDDLDGDGKWDEVVLLLDFKL